MRLYRTGRYVPSERTKFVGATLVLMTFAALTAILGIAFAGGIGMIIGKLSPLEWQKKSA